MGILPLYSSIATIIMMLLYTQISTSAHVHPCSFDFLSAHTNPQTHVCAHNHTCIHRYRQTCTQVHPHLCTPISRHLHTNMYVYNRHTYVCVHSFRPMHTLPLYIYAYVFIDLLKYLYMCTYIYKYTHT